jgi:hypothetical protein
MTEEARDTQVGCEKQSKREKKRGRGSRINSDSKQRTSTAKEEKNTHTHDQRHSKVVKVVRRDPADAPALRTAPVASLGGAHLRHALARALELFLFAGGGGERELLRCRAGVLFLLLRLALAFLRIRLVGRHVARLARDSDLRLLERGRLDDGRRHAVLWLGREHLGREPLLVLFVFKVERVQRGASGGARARRFLHVAGGADTGERQLRRAGRDRVQRVLFCVFFLDRFRVGARQAGVGRGRGGSQVVLGVRELVVFFWQVDVRL